MALSLIRTMWFDFKSFNEKVIFSILSNCQAQPPAQQIETRDFVFLEFPYVFVL